jgi:hypothetical protein
VAKTPKGEQMYNVALLEMKKSAWDKAYKSIQTAVMFEPVAAGSTTITAAGAASGPGGAPVTVQAVPASVTVK